MGNVTAYEYLMSAHLRVSDEDAADFLQSQFSNELRPYETGRCQYGLWLDVKGKVVADGFVLCEEAGEAFRIFSEYSQAADIVGKLERHIIADDVCIETLPAPTAIALMGADAAATLSSLGLEVPAAGRFSRSEGCLVFRGRRCRGDCFELLCLESETQPDLRARLAAEEVAFIGEARMHLERLEAGFPAIPQEIGPQDLPGEGGLTGNAASLTKGCYLGQEVVARMHHVGRPQRSLFVLSGTGDMPNCPAVLVDEAGKKVGVLRSAYPDGSRWIGSGLLKVRFAGAGDTVRAGDQTARIERRLQSGEVKAEA